MIILASNSPRRKEICELLGLEFKIIPAKSEDSINTEIAPSEAVRLVALSKATSVFNEHQQDTVIGSDTAVYCDNEFLGKPENRDDAKRMLRKLSGKTHQVLTGVAIVSKEKQVSFCEKAYVHFAELNEDEIDWYVSSGETDDKAGAYAIQGLGARFVKKIDGDFYAVMGLPCQRLYEELKKF